MSIEINGLEHVYSPNTPFEHAALKGIDCSIVEGKVTAIIGQTGSGKSTLVQHLNGQQMLVQQVTVFIVLTLQSHLLF